MSDAPEGRGDPRKRDDRFSLVMVVLGAAMALAGRRESILLAGGLVVAMSGVLFALRGDRLIEGRGWLRAALAGAVVAVAAHAALEVCQEWVAAQWFAEGATAGHAQESLRRLARLGGGLRIAALAASLCLLLGALVNRVRK